MKKTATLLFGLILLSSIGFTQSTINNQGFENWEQIVVKDSIEHWKTSTQQYQSSGATVNNAYQVGNAQDGNKAIHVETIIHDINNNDTLIGFITQLNADDDFLGFPYTDMVTNLKGWYKCNNIATDTAKALIILKKNGVIYSQSVYKFTGVVSTWTQFDLPLNNGNVMSPDSVFIGFVSSNFEIDNYKEPGNWLEIDNIWFENGGNATSVIPGNSFENLIQESIEQPIDFWTFDYALYNMSSNIQNITKSSDAAQGNSSMRIEKFQANEDTGILALITNGNYSFQNGLNSGTPFNAQPTDYSFQYKYSVATQDTAIALINFFKNGITMNLDSAVQLLPTNVWTTTNISITLSQAPDSVRVTFFVGDSIGSVLLIDDIKFLGGDVGIENNNNSNWTIYPNPANTEINIKDLSNSTISIVDISGKSIYLSNNTMDLVTVPTENWTNGIYFISIQKNNSVETKKIIIKH